jgi:hypothetical protein
VYFEGLAVLGLTSFFSLFFSSSYLPITLFIPVFGITTLGYAGGFKDYLGFASGSFLSSVGFMVGTTLAVYGLKGFFVLSAGPVESLSFGVGFRLLSVIFLAVGSSPSFNHLVAYKSEAIV